jgi:hypothetical protein
MNQPIVIGASWSYCCYYYLVLKTAQLLNAVSSCLPRAAHHITHDRKITLLLTKKTDQMSWNSKCYLLGHVCSLTLSSQ